MQSQKTNMVPIVQLVRASDCGSECRGFESHWAPQKKEVERLPFLVSGGVWTHRVRHRRSRLSEAKESHWAPWKTPYNQPIVRSFLFLKLYGIRFVKQALDLRVRPSALRSYFNRKRHSVWGWIPFSFLNKAIALVQSWHKGKYYFLPTKSFPNISRQKFLTKKLFLTFTPGNNPISNDIPISSVG